MYNGPVMSVSWWKKRLERGWSVDQFEPRLSDSVGLKECQVKSEKNPSVSEKNCTSYRWYINPIISLLTVNVVQNLQVVKFSIVPYGFYQFPPNTPKNMACHYIFNPFMYKGPPNKRCSRIRGMGLFTVMIAQSCLTKTMIEVKHM